jgi:hypothetical protein
MSEKSNTPLKSPRPDNAFWTQSKCPRSRMHPWQARLTPAPVSELPEKSVPAEKPCNYKSTTLIQFVALDRVHAVLTCINT